MIYVIQKNYSNDQGVLYAGTSAKEACLVANQHDAVIVRVFSHGKRVTGCEQPTTQPRGDL